VAASGMPLAPPHGGMRRERERLVDECAICGEPIYTSESGRPSLERARRLSRQLAEHLLSHSATDRMRLAFHAILSGMPMELRLSALRRFNHAVQALLPELESEGVFGIDEALGSVKLYRLWLEARQRSMERCNDPHRAAGGEERSGQDQLRTSQDQSGRQHD
jgi:hypothetical protein